MTNYISKQSVIFAANSTKKRNAILVFGLHFSTPKVVRKLPYLPLTISGLYDEDEISQEVRLGIPDAFRRVAWLHISGMGVTTNYDKLYNDQVLKIFPTVQHQESILWESLYSFLPTGFTTNDHYLTDKGNVAWALPKIQGYWH
jgi:hypothetical protein